MQLLVGCSLAALMLALGPVAAQTVPARSPSTFGLTKQDFETTEYWADWGLGAINASSAYARGFTGNGVLVAVVDSGLDSTHPEFNSFIGKIYSGSRNFIGGSAQPFPIFDSDAVASHGTHVAGTIGAARNDIGMMGVAFDSRIMALFNLGYTSEAIEWAAGNGAQVLNGSYGENYSQEYNIINKKSVENKNWRIQSNIELNVNSTLAEYNALKKAADKDILMVFAASNARTDQPIASLNPMSDALFPFIKPSNANSGIYQFYTNYGKGPDGKISADYAPTGPVDGSDFDFSSLNGYIVSVVAVNDQRQIAAFSNLCGRTAEWCIAAPGVGIYSTVAVGTGPGGSNYGTLDGTSMAAPHVAGAAAVLRQAFPFLTAPQIAQTMFTTATHLGDGLADRPNTTYGWGLLNLGKAIDGPGQFTSTWTVNTTYNGQAYYGRFANDISGVGGLIKIGLGTLELAGTNTYAGGTAVYGGTLAVSRDANLGAAGTGLILGGGTFEVLADGFTTPRPLTLSGPGTLQIDVGTSTFAGPIADGSQPGVLLKTGSGTAVLSAANTFTGGALVGTGTLALTATGSLTAPVLVGSAASFLNAGLVSGSVGNFGVLANSGTITGSVANAGLALNTGIIGGGAANSGSLVNAGTVLGGLTNTGTALNTGAIGGGVTNSGTLATSGTISGGLTNAGTVLASAGRIDGAIANNAGLLAVS
ncbi:S8 family serine peptidase, partial [Methylobacterium sp. C33D]